MSIEADSGEHELSVEELLQLILNQLVLLNARVEHGFETEIEMEDL